MDWPAWKEAFELYVSEPQLLVAAIVAGIAIFVAGIAIFAFAWWRRGHLIEHLELLLAQRDDLNAKFAEGKEKLLELEKQIAAGASRTALSADVVSIATLFGDIQIIINNMGDRLTHLIRLRSDLK